MPAAVQAKVLRAIANREILPVGAVKARPIDVRIVAATNLDLEKEIEEGSFRRDLYYRLNGITLLIPPLRERRAELPELTRGFVAQAARDAGREPPIVSEAAMNLLLQYRWPGNIRELKNVVERAMVLCEGPVIDLVPPAGREDDLASGPLGAGDARRWCSGSSPPGASPNGSESSPPWRRTSGTRAERPRC